MQPTTEAVDQEKEAILSKGRSVLEAESAAIADAQSRLDDSFVGAVRLLLGCKGRVCVTGMGKAGLIGQKIQSTLSSTGTPAYNLHPVEALHGDLGMIHPDDVVISLSKSGSSELVELLPRLKGLGCKIILLTSQTDSLAAGFADHVLHIGLTEEACPLRLAPSSSTAAMLALGDALTLTVMDLKAIQPEQYARYHPGGALGRLLMKVEEVMRPEGDCAIVSESATLANCHRAILDAPHRAGAAMIVNWEGQLCGIMTHGDFFRLFNAGEPMGDRLVTSVMTTSPKCVQRGTRVTEALTLMREYAIDELPVVDSRHKLLGMIDIQDLLSKGFTVVHETV